LNKDFDHFLDIFWWFTALLFSLPSPLAQQVCFFLPSCHRFAHHNPSAISPTATPCEHLSVAVAQANSVTPATWTNFNEQGSSFHIIFWFAALLPYDVLYELYYSLSASLGASSAIPDAPSVFSRLPIVLDKTFLVTDHQS